MQGLGSLEDRRMDCGLDRAAEDHRSHCGLDIPGQLGPALTQHVAQHGASLGRDRADLRVLPERRHVREHPLVQRGIARMAGDELVHRPFDRVAERQLAPATEHGCERVEIGLRLALDERGEQRLLAGEVLVERADAHARELGDAIRGRAIEPDLADDASRGLEDRVYRDPRALLFRGFAWLDRHRPMRVTPERRRHHTSAMSNRILVVGGGIGGLVLARALARLGAPVDVVERAPSLRAVGAGITLGANAMRVLDELGVGEAIAARGMVMKKGAITDASGRALSEQRFDAMEARWGRAYAIHRGALHEELADGLAGVGAGVRIVCDATVEQLRERDGVVEAALVGGERMSYRAVIGADGARSAVRTLVFGENPPRYAGYTCWRWTGALAGIDGGVEMWGRGARAGLVTIAPGQVYAFFVANAPAGTWEDPKNGRVARVRERFAGFGGDLPRVLAAMGDDDAPVLHHDIEEVEQTPWVKGAIGLLGDAAHAMTPNFGQGAAMAIEDAIVLARELVAHNDAAAALLAYEARRRPRVEDIQRGARRLGTIGQLQSPVATWARDLAIRLAPASSTIRTLEKIVSYVP